MCTHIYIHLRVSVLIPKQTVKYVDIKLHNYSSNYVHSNKKGSVADVEENLTLNLNRVEVK